MWPFKKKTKKITTFIKIIAIRMDGLKVQWFRELPNRDHFYDLKTKINEDFRNRKMCKVDVPDMDDTCYILMDQVQWLSVSLVEGTSYE